MNPSPGAAAPAPADALLRVERLAVTHDGEAVATPSGVSFTISRGDVVLVLGPSGCGKSTLALALDGLIPHAVPATLDGRVLVAGYDTATTPVATLSTHVGMVFQDPDAQLVTGTLQDEVAFGPENLLLPVAEVLARSETALRRVGLWERRADNPDLLSGGGRQRLAIACALAMGSPVVVLDEPTANLDPQGIEDVYAALADLVAAGDHAIVLIEHNLDAAMDLVDRVVVLDRAGRLFADGPAEEVMRAHADDLLAMGVWLPTATLAAMRLRAAGWPLHPLPVTGAQLRAALEATPGPDGAAPDDAAPATGTTGRDAASAPLVRVRGLTVRRGRDTLLHDVDLDIAAGAFVAIVGANGAGKTTLAQAIAGVVPPGRGMVHIGDLDVGRASVRALGRRVGFVFQNPEHQFIAATVREEIAHGLRVQRLPAEEVRARTDDLLARFGLTERADVHPFLLSGGQKRRLSVGTALVAGAPLLILDEPTFGQDRERAEELLTLLTTLNAAGTTVVVVTHDMQLVTEHADEVVVLADGRVTAQGPTGEVFADDTVLRQAGLRPPPLAQALRGLQRHPHLARVSRLADLAPARIGVSP